MRLDLNNQLSMSKSSLVLSKDKKQNFLLMLGDKLTKSGIMVNMLVVMLTFLLYGQH